MPSTPNFALPGLMEISTPELDRARPIIRLHPHRIQDSNWLGIPSIGPVTPGGAQPTFPLASVRMIFAVSVPVLDAPLFELSTNPAEGQGLVTIDNAATWLFHVPVQELPLPLGDYQWELHTTDSAGDVTVYYVGSQLVTP